MTMIRFTEDDEEISACFSAMAELRPHLERDAFVSRVRRQERESGFKLVFLADEDVKAVAGIRIGEWLAGGKYLDIEDLATRDGDRSKGYGGKLFDWIVGYAKTENCAQIRLVSRVTRFDAHRFYLNKRMNIEAYYFSMAI